MIKKDSDLALLFNDLISKGILIQATFSNPLIKEEVAKVILRPTIIKNRQIFQFTSHQKAQVFHQNYSLEKCLELLPLLGLKFKQIFIQSEGADFHVLRNKQNGLTILKKNSEKLAVVKNHNRQKDYLLLEGEVVPFLVALGIMDAKGKVFRAKADKFRQINRFLEVVDDCLDLFSQNESITIVDFGCGKSYLTFALYHFLKFKKKLFPKITGIDLKKEVIESCQALTKELGYEKELHFIHGDIKDYEAQSVDCVISLHACNTATDIALGKAVEWQSRLILAVPCCQPTFLDQ